MNSEQIDKLLEGLGDDVKKASLKADDNTQDIAKMTMVSPIDGVVVERDVVSGNFYDQKDILLTLSPMDQLWVWGNVFESDQDKVHINQKWEIVLPFTNEKFEGKVESISNGVDPETTNAPDPGLDPQPGQHAQGPDAGPGHPPDHPSGRRHRDPPERPLCRQWTNITPSSRREAKPATMPTEFERRKLEIEQENHDVVVVKKGLKAGDRVVSNGSLILAQMFEDMSTADTGMPCLDLSQRGRRSGPVWVEPMPPHAGPPRGCGFARDLGHPWGFDRVRAPGVGSVRSRVHIDPRISRVP